MKKEEKGQGLTGDYPTRSTDGSPLTCIFPSASSHSMENQWMEFGVANCHHMRTSTPPFLLS